MVVMAPLKPSPFLRVSLLMVALSPLTVMSPVSAIAQDARDLPADDRYHLIEIEGGALRIDRQTGEVSECANEASGWVCRLSADDRLAYEAEINRLDTLADEQAERIAALEDRLAAIREYGLTTPDGSSPTPPPDDPGDTLRLPSDEELDAVMDTAEEVMRRFFGMVQDLREDLEAQNGAPDSAQDPSPDAASPPADTP